MAEAASLRFGPVVSGLRSAALVFLVVLLSALFGIVTRPVGQLAAIWFANAVLLGLFIRLPP